MDTMIWGVEVDPPAPKKIVPFDVSAHAFMVANAVIYGAEDAETVRASAGEFATQMQDLLIQLSELGVSEVNALIEKYVSKL